MPDTGARTTARSRTLRACRDSPLRAAAIGIDVRNTQWTAFVLAGGFASHGEPARLLRDTRGQAKEFWLGGTKLLPEAKAAKELSAKYRRRP